MAAIPCLPDSEVRLYSARVPELESEPLVLALRPWLTEPEIEDARKLQRLSVRHENLVARALVRAALSDCAPVEPGAWEFERSEFGKPRIVAPAGHTGLRFNLSHSHGLVVCAVAAGIELGIDVESHGRMRIDADAANGYLSPREAAALALRTGEDRQRCFFKYWTLKEAYLKATGAGLQIPLDSFSIVLDGDIRIECHDSEWDFCLMEPTAEHQLALCARRGQARLRVMEMGNPLPI